MAIIDQIVNLAGAGVQSATGGGGMLTTGAYRVQITAIEDHTAKGETESKSYKVSAKVIDGEFAGNVQYLYLGKDFSKDGVRKQWRTLLLSCGYTAEQVDQKNLKLSDALFLNQPAAIYFKAKDPNDPTSQPDRRFIALSEYETLVGDATVSNATIATSPVATQAAVPAMTMTPKPAGAAGLRAMIGK